MTSSAQTASAKSQPHSFVLDTSALLKLYLADGPLPPSLELAMQRGCSASELAMAALEQAMALSLSVYDASFLALALKHDALLITADKQLAKAAASLGCFADAAE